MDEASSWRGDDKGLVTRDGIPKAEESSLKVVLGGLI